MNELQVFICGTAEAVDNRKGARPFPTVPTKNPSAIDGLAGGGYNGTQQPDMSSSEL